MSTFQGLLHPHHVSLTRQPYSLQTLLQSVAGRVDPYYVYDHIPPYRGFSAPRFNVTETETNYFLEGELPGVGDKTSINVMWHRNQVLIVHGAIEHADVKTAPDPVQPDAVEGEHLEAPVRFKGNQPKATFPRQLLHERHLGPFERSFTFPDEVEEDDLRASLKDGLLRIVVPRKTRSTISNKKVSVE